jgi:hypothetical protein
VLFRYLRKDQTSLYALPLVMLVWANTHGGFVAGLGAIGLAIALRTAAHVTEHGWHPVGVLRSVRPLIVVFAASVLATFVNPQGARVWRYVVDELMHSTNRRYISEWSPPGLANDPWSAAVLILLVAGLAVAAAMAIVHRPAEERQLDLAWTLSSLPLLTMSFVSVRHVPLAAIWTAPIIVRLASGLSWGVVSPAARRTWFLVRGLSVVPVCLTCVVVYSRPQPVISTGPPTLGSTHPCRVLEYVREAGLQGRMYTPLWWGSYVTWSLYPAVQVSMDGRNISRYPDSLVLENLRFYTDPADEVDLDAPLRHGSDFLLMPRDAASSQRIQQDDRWRPLFVDRDATVFVRADRVAEAPARLPLAAESTACQFNLE